MADALSLWLPYEELPMQSLDWGSVLAHSSATTQVRVHNDSYLYRADDVVVRLDPVGAQPATPADVAAQHLLSADGRVFTATLALGDIEPGALSPVLTVRRNIAAACPVGTYAFRVVAAPTGWT